ncbi:MAG: hypothetical protein ABRQ27_10830 [Clostridiaceae bacterium]
MASHDMAEVESLCDRIAILKEGKIAFSGITDKLTNETKEKCRIHVKTERPLQNAQYEQGYWVVASENIGDSLYELLKVCKETHNKVLDVKIERTTLEQGFMDIVREGK